MKKLGANRAHTPGESEHCVQAVETEVQAEVACTKEENGSHSWPRGPGVWAGPAFGREPQ